jgi:hypothetical protein
VRTGPACTDRTAGEWPATVVGGKPPSSASGTSASTVPSASAAGAQPEPSTTAASCRGWAVSSASWAALARAASYGSAIAVMP